MSSRQIDYTSRDYDALRSDMIRMIQARLPGWNADRSDFGTLLVEAIAYGLDTVHYYLDRAANEAYLSTALQRESLYSIARMFNYTPRQATPAQVRLAFRNAGGSEVVVPKGTRCQATVTTTYDSGGAGSVQINFETVEEVIVGPQGAGLQDNAKYVTAIEGRTYSGETLGISGGEMRQEYRIGRSPVIPGSVGISTVLGESVEEWREVIDILQWGSLDRVFQVVTATDGSSIVVFGDGVNGSIPPMYSVISATYRIGGGKIGNVSAGSILTIVEPVLYGVSVINDDRESGSTAGGNATGGNDPESIDSIRVNAAKSFRSRDRAVTVADFESVTSNSPWFTKAKAVSGSASSVVVWAVPVDDGTGAPSITVELKDRLKAYLEARAMAGVTVTVDGPQWKGVWISMVVNKLATASAAQIEQEIARRMDSLYNYTSVEFGTRVSIADILPALAGVPGVTDIKITDLSTIDPTDSENYVGPPSTDTVDVSKLGDGSILYFSSAQHLRMTIL